jgi:hypothetical protein
MRNILLLIISFTFLLGCAGTKRGVQNNMFYSSSKPKMSIKIDQDFKYAESKSNMEVGTNPMAGNSTSNIKVVHYPFYNHGNERSIEIVIQEITTPNWFFLPGHFRDVENKIESGDLVINGKKFEYCTTAQDIGLSACMLSRVYGRTVSANNNCRIIIFYNQTIRDYSICNDWKDNHLTETEKELLENFIADSEKDLKIIDYEPPE